MQEAARNTVVIPAFPADLEAEARDLYALALCGSEQLFHSVADPLGLLANDPIFRRAYRCAAHEGFYRAQEHVVERLSQPDVTVTPAQRALYRTSIDSIAWTLLDRQLYLARRFYLGQRPPDIRQGGFAAVKEAVEHFHTADHACFPLITDLTSFIQVGDLLVADLDRGMTIVEVKSGTKNSEILEFAHAMMQEPCSHAMHEFRAREGEAAFQQLGRVLRQTRRMEHVKEIANTGASVDPDEQKPVQVIESAAAPEDYDAYISSVIEKSHERGWAIGQVDDCLFVGAYRGRFRAAAEYIFRSWFEGCGGEVGFPLENLMVTCTNSPLALPIFAHTFAREAKFDLLFGRVVVYIALDMNAFIELCKSEGLDIGWTTRRMAERLKKEESSKLSKPWTHKHRAIASSDGGAIHDGLLMRMLHHGVTPRFAAQILKDYRGQDGTA